MLKYARWVLKLRPLRAMDIFVKRPKERALPHDDVLTFLRDEMKNMDFVIRYLEYVVNDLHVTNEGFHTELALAYLSIGATRGCGVCSMSSPIVTLRCCVGGALQ